MYWLRTPPLKKAFRNAAATLPTMRNSGTAKLTSFVEPAIVAFLKAFFNGNARLRLVAGIEPLTQNLGTAIYDYAPAAASILIFSCKMLYIHADDLVDHQSMIPNLGFF